MNKKYTLAIFIIVIGLFSGYFLTIIFTKNNDLVDNIPQGSTKISIPPSVENKDLDVKAVALPSELPIPKSQKIDFKTAKSSSLDITYTNKSQIILSNVQIQVLSRESTAYTVGSSGTAKFNKQDTALNKHATFDVKTIQPGKSMTASIPVFAKEAGTIVLYAYVTTNKGKSSSSPPVTIIVR